MHANITKILVPTDFSATADAALDYAKVLAGKLGATLHVLHVLEDAYVGGSFAGELYVPESPGLRAAMVKEAESLLAHRVSPQDREELHAETAVIVGRSFKAIVDYADEQRADLIVIGTHGRTGMAHLLLGSVAERIVRTAPCPVLTVRDTPAPAATPARVPILPETVIV